MINFRYDGVRFANGNLNIRFSPEEIKNAQGNEYTAVCMATNKLWKFDCFQTPGSFCNYGNAGWTIGFHSTFNGRKYRLSNADIEALIAGKTVKLIPVEE